MAIGSQIKLDGEREFKKALADINAGLRVTASELMLVTAKYSDNATSVKALTEKNEVLEKRIYGQTEKIAKLREALTESAREYGESDTKTMKWQVSLNKAEAELVKMEKELQDNSKELDTARKNMEKYGLATDEVAEQTSTFGERLSDVISGLGVNLPAGADKAIRALDGTKASTIALVGVVTGLTAGFGKLTMETAKTADEILTLSSITGLSTDTIQELNYAAELVDVSAETITNSMAKMIRSMDDARKGTGDAADAFHTLRLRVTDGNGQLKDSEQMFYEVIDALGRMTNETERDAAAMAIFGRSARELNPLIEVGSQKLKEYAEQAQALGYVLSPETLERFGELDNSMQIFNNQLTAVSGILAQALLPVMTLIFNILNKVDPKVIAIGAALGTIGIISFSVVKGIMSMAASWQMYTASTMAANAATTTATVTSTAFQAVSLKTIIIITGVIAVLAGLAAVIAILVGKAPEIEKTVNGVTNSISRVTQPLARIGSNATGTSNWRGGLTWVGERGPELIDLPAGTRIYSNQQSMDMINRGIGGGDTYNLYVKMSEVDEVYKLVEVFKSMKQKERAGMVMA